MNEDRPGSTDRADEAPQPKPYATPPRRDWSPKGRSGRRNLIAIVVVILVALGLAWLLTPHGQGHGGQAGGGAAAGGSAGAGGAGGGRAGGRGGGRRPPTTVALATATVGDIPVQLDALGAVTPNATVTVRTQITGTLMQVYFREGQMVTQGQVLAKVDPRPYEIALQQANAAMLRDQAALANAQLDLARYQTLQKQDSIAGQQVDTQRALVKQDEGVIASDRAAVASARLNLIYTAIRAPVSGRVGLRQVDVGNYVTGSEANGIVILAQVQPIGVIFSIPEDSAPAIMQQFARNAVLPVTALDRSGATVIATGTLNSLDNQVDPSTGTVKAKAMFANTNGLLLPQQFVNVRVLVDTIRNVVTIPSAAVRHGPQGDFVFILQPDRTARMQLVKVGPSLGETASISSGVKAGDQVITAGGDQLRDGSRVQLPGQKPMQRQKPKPKGFLGWFKGLFGGNKDQEQATAGGDGRTSGGASGGAGQAGGGRAGGAQRIARMEQALGLDAQQKAKADQIFAAARQKAMAQANGDPDAMRGALRQAYGGAFTQLEPILRPDQKAKVAQLKARMAQGRGSAGGGDGGGGGGQ